MRKAQVRAWYATTTEERKRIFYAPRMKPDPTRNARSARFRTKKDGGSQVNTRVGADAARSLAKLRETRTLRQAIGHALTLATLAPTQGLRNDEPRFES